MTEMNCTDTSPQYMRNGLPLRLVECYESRSGIWHGRRERGNSIATGYYHFGGPSFDEIQLVIPEETKEEAQLTAHICDLPVPLCNLYHLENSERRLEGNRHLESVNL